MRNERIDPRLLNETHYTYFFRTPNLGFHQTHVYSSLSLLVNAVELNLLAEDIHSMFVEKYIKVNVAL